MPASRTSQTLVLTALTLVAFGPGALDLDAQRMLGQALNDASDGWHPTTLVALWRLSLWLAQHVQPLRASTIAAWLVFAASQLLLVSGLVRLLGGLRALIVLVLPIVVTIDLRLTKETWFAGFALWTVIALTERRRKSAVFAIAGLLSLRRHALALVLALLATARQHVRIVAFGAVLATATSALLVSAPAGLPEQQVLMHDIAALSPSELTWLCTPPVAACLDLLRTTFDPLAVDGVIWGATPLRHVRDGSELRRLQQTWTSLILSHPVAYLRHRAAIFVALLDQPWSTAFAGAVPNPFGISERPPDGAAVVRDLVQRHPSAWWLQPWVYLLAGVAALFRAADPRRKLLLVIAWTFMATLFVAAPSPQLRYSFMPIVLSVSALLLPIRQRR